MTVRAQFEADLVTMLPELRGLAIKRLRNVAEADDLVQRTSLRALVAWEQFQAGTNFKAWMHRIMFNEMVSGYRRQKRAPVSLDESDVGMASCPPLQDKIVDDKQLRNLIELLPARWRHAIVRCCVEGWTYEEAAAEISTDVGTIKSRLWRARQSIQQMLGAA